MPPAMEAQRAAWVRSAMVQRSRLLPESHFAGAQADREGSVERRWGSEVVAFFASTALCGGEDGSSGAGSEETGLGAGAGEEWSGVQKVGVGGRCGDTGSERSWAGVGEDVGVGLGGDGD
jgi:hypothetical protein